MKLCQLASGQFSSVTRHAVTGFKAATLKPEANILNL